jgi:hypothetical protein
MNIVRRIIGTVLIVAAGAGVIAIDRQGGATQDGAASALVTLGGFPQAVAGSRISTSWFCPGAAAGDGLDAATVVISNPSDVAITASLSLFSDAAAETQNISVAPRDRLSVDVLRGRTVGVVVPAVEIIGGIGTVEQQLVYAAGDVTSQCVSQTSNAWYFADGFTAEGSSQRIVLTNPYPESAVVNVSYTTAEGRRTPANLQGVILPALSAKSLSMSDVGAANESQIAVEVIATTGQVIASRMQHYIGGGRLGYSTTVGTPEALKDWWFTAGRTGSQVTEQLVVFNPSEVEAQLNVAFFGEGITNGVIAETSTAALPSEAVTIPAGGIVYINTDNIADLPKGDHAMVVSTLNNSRVVVEHVLSQRTGGSSFTAITNGIPAGLVSTKWRIPSGLAKGARHALSVLNTTATDGTFTVSAIGPGGLLDLPNLVNVPIAAASLISLEVPEGVNEGEVVITATVDVAIHRRTTRGHGLVGFGIVGALPVRGK